MNGVTYKRNRIHIRPRDHSDPDLYDYHVQFDVDIPPSTHCESNFNQEAPIENEPVVDPDTTPQPQYTRPRRERREPAKFKDFYRY